MRVEPISNGNLRIWLTADEMPTDNDDVGNWMLLRRVLQTAQRSLGRFGKQLVAELIPVADGGLLLVSSRRMLPDGMPVYHLDTLDAVYGLAEAWVSLPSTQRSNPQTALYESPQGYDVVVYPLSHLTRQETALLHTYGRFAGCDAAAVAHVAEYGRLLASGDVFYRLTACEPLPPEPPDLAN